MRIGFDARCLQTRSAGGGIGRYARGLLEHLPPRLRSGDEILVYLSAHRPTPELPSLTRSRLVHLRRPARAITLWDPIVWPIRMKRDGIDLFHSPLYGIPVRRPRGIGVVATVHDLIPVLFPESVTAKQRLIFKRHFTRALMANRIIVPSSRTRQDLVERLAADPRRIAVIPLGLEREFQDPGERPDPREVDALRKRLTGGRPYILHVGGFDRYKELPLLLSAFAPVASNRKELALVVCGDPRVPGGREFAASAERSGLGGRVVLPGRALDSELLEIYAGAELFVFPSRYEGFGLPPLEAMACGCPVVASSGGSLGELLGESAYLVHPTDSAALAAAIEHVLGDEVLRRRLVSAGRERVKAFTWEKAAGRTIEVYGRALAEARGEGNVPEEQPA